MRARLIRAAAAAVCGALIGAALVSAQSGGSNPITACLGPAGQTGGRIVTHFTASPANCAQGQETPLTWNAAGPEGAAGPAGDPGPTGPAGPQGPAGARGLDADIRTHAVVATAAGAPPFESTTVVARCPSGERVVSGGFSTDSDFFRTEFYPTENRPLYDGTGWVVTMHEFYSRKWRLSVAAVCASRPVRMAP